MTKEFVIDIIFAINIVLKCLTTFIPNGESNKYEVKLTLIFINYARTMAMYIDLLATLPTLITLNNEHDQYFYKMLRFFYLPDVYDTANNLIRFVLFKIGIAKGSIGKIQHVVFLLICLF
jgi:hypothetical protein